MRPLLSYFAVQEIPAALVTFVSLLIFIQTGTSPALSTVYSALLSLPWILKLWMRRRRIVALEQCGAEVACGKTRALLLVSELVLMLLLVALAAVLNPNWLFFRLLGVGSGNGVALLAILFLLSLVTSWHEVQADIYYHVRLRPSLRSFYDAPRLLLSQGMVVMTYGLLLVLVGTLQVLSRSIFVSWSIACVLVAGGVGVSVLWHLVLFFCTRQLPFGYNVQLHRRRPLLPRVRFMSWLLLMLLLLPQSLMFYSRVLFMIAPKEEGGLARSLQEVGFVHGVMGALGFCLGLMLSRFLVRRIVSEPMRRKSGMRFGQYAIPGSGDTIASLLSARQLLLVSPLLLSPLLYCYMSVRQPSLLWEIAACTFVAQFMFGYGLHRLLSALGLSATGSLRVPVVAAALCLPVAASGWMCSAVSYQCFFLVDALTALLPIIFLHRKFVVRDA